MSALDSVGAVSTPSATPEAKSAVAEEEAPPAPAPAKVVPDCPHDWVAPTKFTQPNAFGFCWDPADPAAGRHRLDSGLQLQDDYHCPSNLPQKCHFKGTTWGNTITTCGMLFPIATLMLSIGRTLAYRKNQPLENEAPLLP